MILRASIKHIFVLLFTLLFVQSAYAQCAIRDSIYTDGLHELRFDRAQKSVTTYDFSIINTESGESYFGKITYGNGYSVPQTSIDISCRDDGDNTDNNCRYHGIPYEIKGKDTTYAFSVDYNTQNPILFPDLHRAFYGKRNNPGLDSDHLPKNIWLFKGCVEKTTSP